MTTRPDDRTRRDEATLAPYFAAARSDDPLPSRALLTAILADAGAASAARAAPFRPVAAAPRPRPEGATLAASDGWKIAAALAAAAILGFWMGLSGAVDLTGVDLTGVDLTGVDLTGVDLAGAPAATTAEAQADPVADFFDLAAAE